MADDDNKNDDKKRDAKKTLVGIGSEAPPSESEDTAEAKSEDAAEAKSEDAEAKSEDKPEEKKRAIKKTLAGVGAIAAPTAAEIAKDAEEKAAEAKDDAEEKAEEAAEEAEKVAAAAASDSDSSDADADADSDADADADADSSSDDSDSDDHDDHDGGDGHDGHDDEDEEPETRVALYLAEYETPDELVAAAEKVRDAGYEKWDCHTPYPMHGLDDAMGLPPTKIGLISFGAAMTGLITAVLMIQYMNNWDYPINIGGKPVGAGGFPTMVPIMFELTILLCGFGTLFGMLHLAKLPRHHHPIFESTRFEAATDDKFFISIEVADEQFDVIKTRELLESTSPSFLELVEEEVPT